MQLYEKFGRYEDNPALIRYIKKEGLAEIRAAADQTAAALCPCCAGTAALRVVLLTGAAAVQIVCDRCGLRTSPAIIGTMGDGKHYTATDRIREAAARWNRRA